MSDLISIILPVYNSQSTIENTIKSILMQTYTNFELICVNDGSSDNSVKIIERLIKTDKRIRLINQHNQGASGARNTGIKFSKGEYIAFIDSDDLYEPNFLNILFNTMLKYKADISMCNIIQMDGSLEYSWHDIKLMDTNQSVFNEYAEGNICNRVWNKLYTKKVINGVFFPKKRPHVEDAIWTPMVMERTRKMVRIPNGYYHYIIRKGSLSHNSFNKKYALDYLINTLKGTSIILKHTNSSKGIKNRLNNVLNLIKMGIDMQLDLQYSGAYQLIRKIIIDYPSIYNFVSKDFEQVLNDFKTKQSIEVIVSDRHKELLIYGNLRQKLSAIKWYLLS